MRVENTSSGVGNNAEDLDWRPWWVFFDGNTVDGGLSALSTSRHRLVGPRGGAATRTVVETYCG